MIMGIVALLVRLILAATFAVAGVAKLTNLERSRKAIRDFGLPGWLAAPLGVLLPVVELAAALLLLTQSTVLWGDLAAIALLLAFIVAISINLSLGRKPDCNCFGQVHSKPIGWPTLLRNLVLLAGASVVLWDWRVSGPIGVFHSLAGLSTMGILLVVQAIFTVFVLAFTAWVAFHLLRQNGRLLLRMDALESQLAGDAALHKAAPTMRPLGSPAPYFDLPQLNGSDSITLHNLLSLKKPVVLIFSDPDCGPCSALLPEIARWEQEQSDRLTIALVSRGPREANRLKVAKYALRHVLLQKDRETAAAYEIHGTPGAILVESDGRIASAPALGSEAIAGLIAASSQLRAGRAESAHPIGGNTALPSDTSKALQVGEPAPGFRLPDLHGKMIDLADFRQRDTLVLFWNPTCGYCSRMLPDLKQWEDNRDVDAPQLLVVSTGAVETNRAMDLQSTVVLDQNFATGRQFHVRGTPSAVLIDAEGNIASGVASGAPAVLVLANSRASFVESRNGHFSNV